MADNTVQMGALKPEYIQRAASLGNQMNHSSMMSAKYGAQARHPVNSPARRKMFMEQALAHTERTFQAGNQIMGLGIQPKGSFQGRQANFQSAANAQLN